jgi:hypothetical protein
MSFQKWYYQQRKLFVEAWHAPGGRPFRLRESLVKILKESVILLVIFQGGGEFFLFLDVSNWGVTETVEGLGEAGKRLFALLFEQGDQGSQESLSLVVPPTKEPSLARVRSWADLKSFVQQGPFLSFFRPFLAGGVGQIARAWVLYEFTTSSLRRLTEEVRQASGLLVGGALWLIEAGLRLTAAVFCWGAGTAIRFVSSLPLPGWRCRAFGFILVVFVYAYALEPKLVYDAWHSFLRACVDWGAQ